MKKLNYKLVLVIGIFLMGCPLIGQCSWNEVCETDLSGRCDIASQNYTVPYCVSSNVDYANICNFESLTNSLSTHLREANFNTKDMISQYCSSLLGDQNYGRIYYAKPSMVDSGWDWSMTFDSHQSMFVYALCSSFKNKSGSLVILDSSFSEIFKGDVTKLLKLQQRSKGKDQCSLVDSPTLDECDMSSYATEIFSAIMSDIFKIKYAQVFHVDSVDIENQNKKERMITFLSGYFSKVDENFLDMFPDTIDAIDSNQKYYKNVLETLKLLDNSILANRAKELGCPATGNIAGVDFVACALHGSQGNGSSLDPAFETLFYNEMLSYRIFVSYYWHRVEGKVGNNAVSNDRKAELQSNAINLQAYSNLQIEAAQQTLHDFEDLTMTYPLHVGLLLYQEKLREFRNQYLPPVVQLFYSLSEKLQNVQLPN